MIKTINGWNNYKITDEGKVISKERFVEFPKSEKHERKGYMLKEHVMKTRYNKCGYEYVTLKQDGRKRSFTIHKLVAEHFIPNPENKPQINHIDLNKKNNHISNLEWVTPKENAQHYHKLNDKPNYNEHSFYLIRNNEIKFKGSSKECAEYIKEHDKSIKGNVSSVSRNIRHAAQKKTMRYNYKIQYV